MYACIARLLDHLPSAMIVSAGTFALTRSLTHPARMLCGRMRLGMVDPTGKTNVNIARSHDEKSARLSVAAAINGKIASSSVIASLSLACRYQCRIWPAVTRVGPAGCLTRNPGQSSVGAMGMVIVYGRLDLCVFLHVASSLKAWM